jgi:hypothetical protein
MLGELEDEASIRARRVQSVFVQAGLPTRITRHVEQWLHAHTAFVVPIAFALYCCDTNAARLASDPITLRLMVRATQQAFRALQATGNSEIPTNLKVLYLRMPEAFAVRYWRRALAGPRGELWFAAHSRAAPEEIVPADIASTHAQRAFRRRTRARPERRWGSDDLARIQVAAGVTPVEQRLEHPHAGGGDVLLEPPRVLGPHRVVM